MLASRMAKRQPASTTFLRVLVPQKVCHDDTDLLDPVEGSCLPSRNCGVASVSVFMLVDCQYDLLTGIAYSSLTSLEDLLLLLQVFWCGHGSRRITHIYDHRSAFAGPRQVTGYTHK
jgi:hypothetical protein